jgi:hypothetical protein
MKSIILFSLLFVGCCTVPNVQTVQTVEPIPVNPIKFEVTNGQGQIDVNWNITTDTLTKVVTKTQTIKASLDTVIKTENGSVKLAIRFDSSKRKSWSIIGHVKPDSIPKGTKVKAEVTKEKPSWKEVYFWHINLPLLGGSILFLFTLIAFIRKVK